MELNSNHLKIAFFLPNLSGGGAERVLLNLANGIAMRGYNVDVVASAAKGEFIYQVLPEVAVIDLGAQRVMSSILPLSAYLKNNQPDVLISAIHANFAAILAKRLARSHTKIIVTQHTNMSVYSDNANSWKVKIEPEIARHMFPQADYIIAVSNGVADNLSKASKLQRDRIEVIYNPVIMPDIGEKAEADFHHPWYELGEPPVILSVGRLVPEKNFSALIDAFAQVRKKRAVRLMILGEGAERSMLEQRARSLGVEEDVSLAGFVENPYAYMAHADIFVLSSIFEGLPTVLVEALYCGLPVVSTDCPSGPSEILDGGRFGLLAPPQNPQALARAIERALDGDVPSPAAESWQPYLMDNVIDQYLAVLQT